MSELTIKEAMIATWITFWVGMAIAVPVGIGLALSGAPDWVSVGSLTVVAVLVVWLVMSRTIQWLKGRR